MNKPFLLIAGDDCYPSSGTGDWIGCYETYEEAKNQVRTEEVIGYFKQGKLKGEIKYILTTHYIKEEIFSWYNIVNLREWTDD